MSRVPSRTPLLWLFGVIAAALAAALLLAFLLPPQSSDVSPQEQPIARNEDLSQPVEQPTPHLPLTSEAPIQLGMLEQYMRSGAKLPPGGKTPDGVVLKVSTEGGSASTLVEVEIKSFPSGFDGAALRALPPGGDRYAVFDLALNPSPYHWRARARDGKDVTPWREFGAGNAEDFTVAQAPRPAAESRPPPAEVARAITQESISAEGGEGDHRPNPSNAPPFIELWTMLKPFALVLSGIGLVVAIGGGVIAVRRYLKRKRAK